VIGQKFSSLQVCDQVCDLDSVMEFGLKYDKSISVAEQALLRLYSVYLPAWELAALTFLSI